MPLVNQSAPAGSGFFEMFEYKSASKVWDSAVAENNKIHAGMFFREYSDSIDWSRVLQFYPTQSRSVFKPHRKVWFCIYFICNKSEAYILSTKSSFIYAVPKKFYIPLKILSYRDNGS